MERYLFDFIKQDLKQKMVFVGGPRQVGKTTLALKFLEPAPADETHPAYFNWDDPTMRSAILEAKLPVDPPLLVLDEIHKFRSWRNLVKGLYDTRKSKQSFLITGSARLDYYRKGGDSLQGRYHYHRFHPISPGELLTQKKSLRSNDIEQLLKLGGFPEPFLSGSETSARRWRRERQMRVVDDDLRDLEQVKDISNIHLLLSHLPRMVGSPLSVESLRSLLEVAHESVERWITILENLYVCFRIAPYGERRIRALKKEKKLYFWDWSMIEDTGARFENLIASQLLKYCHHQEDISGHDMELRYLRDRDGREVDFVVLKDSKPLFAVECKSKDKSLSRSIKYFSERIGIPKFYQVHLREKDFGDESSGGRVLPLKRFCELEHLP